MTPDDVKALARPTLRHRVQLRPEAELEGVTADWRARQRAGQPSPPRADRSGDGDRQRRLALTGRGVLAALLALPVLVALPARAHACWAARRSGCCWSCSTCVLAGRRRGSLVLTALRARQRAARRAGAGRS